MKADHIKEIEIDNSGRLRIYPEKAIFNMIWRSAAEVHWDDKDAFLYSPKPREWTYIDWYKHILSVVKTEYGYELIQTSVTVWNNIPTSLKQQMNLI